MDNSNTKEKTLPPILEHLLRWEEVGIKLYDLQTMLYDDADEYHTVRDCTEFESSQASESRFKSLPPTQKDVSVNALFEIQEAGRLCPDCLMHLEFDFDSNTNGKFEFYAINFIAKWIRPLLELKLEKRSVKGVGASINDYHSTRQAILALADSHRLPGSEAIVEALQAKLNAFEQELKDFRESSEGNKSLLKHVNRAVFETNSVYSSLPSKSLDNQNDAGMLKEAKKFKKGLRKQAKKLSQASLYSLCSNANDTLGTAIAEDSKERIPKEELNELELIRTGLSFMIRENWLDPNASVVVLPYTVMLYIQSRIKSLKLESVNLSARPSERLVECMSALYTADSDGISFLQAYNAAVAID